MRVYIVSAFVGLLSSVLFSAVHNYVYDRQIGVVRLDEILIEQVSSVGSRGFKSEEEVIAQGELYAEALKQALKDVEAHEKVVLLVAPAVVSSAPDYTEIVKHRIRELMQ